MSYIPQLIPIYAQHTVADVESRKEILERAFGGRTLNELSELPGFSKDQHLVRTLKQALENDQALYDTADTAEQISNGLKALMRIAIYHDASPTTVALMIDTLRDLFLAIYAVRWTAAQRRHFEFVAGRLRGWHAYFLSYTNRGATIVNDEYRSVIKKYIDPQVRKSRRPDRDNMLADAIVNWLERRKLGRRSFYDKKRIEAGDYLEHAIEPAVRDALAFVQLVQLDTFDAAENVVNWSFREFDLFNRLNEAQLVGQAHYRAAFESRFIAVLLGEPTDLELADYMLPLDFRPWKRRIFADAKNLRLPADKPGFDAVMKSLEAAILHLAYRIIENVPA
jgi:hypothetical protein